MAPAASRPRPLRVLSAATAAGIAVLLHGCGQDNGPNGTTTTTTTASTLPAREVDCDASFARGHCTKCWFTGGTDGHTVCQACSAPYSLDSVTQTCTVSCANYTSAATPGMPATATANNGMAWPAACWDDETAHFFTVGDWGGVCSWGPQNVCDEYSNPHHPYQPFPMNNRPPGMGLQEPVDFTAQHLVRDRMVNKTAELRALGQAPKFVINVGDNFYPGGIDYHCSSQPGEASFNSTQFAQIFEQMYPVDDLGNIEWWSVLGNHDYGGVCYIKGWDQQIFYTYKPDGRWILPAQYWSRRAQFKTFSVDFFFLDTNIYDTQNPAIDPKHNICGQWSNPGKYCELEKYPPAPGTSASSCPSTGPNDPYDCVMWFRRTWKKQYDWFLDLVNKSDADWQIVVTHYPAAYSPGKSEDGSFLNWAVVAKEYGIDLIISGHTHEQKVYYKNSPNGVDMGDTAWIVSGGGGGITSELYPTSDGDDDAYGFMDLKISADNIEITAISHGGTKGRYIERSKTVVEPVGRPTRTEPGRLQTSGVEVV